MTAMQVLNPILTILVIGILIAVMVLCFMVIRRMDGATSHLVRSLYVAIATLSFAEIMFFLAGRHPTIVEFILCASIGLLLLCDRRKGIKARQRLPKEVVGG